MSTAHLDTFIRDGLPPASQQPEFLFDLPELRYPERLNAAVELMAKKDPQALAVLNDRGAWTYRQIDDLSDRIARVLVEEEGLVSGNRVLLRGANGATLFASWLAILKAGGIVVATMPLLRSRELCGILDRARISHAIVDSRRLDDFEEAAAAAVRPPRLLRYDGDAGTGELEAKAARLAGGFEAVRTYRDDVAILAFTSGTTGRPKGCIHFHRDLLASADSFARHLLNPDPSARWTCSAPIAFTFGLGMQLVFPWRFGGTAVTIEQPTPAEVAAQIARHRVTVLATAPAAYKAIASLAPAPDLSTLRTCVSAGVHLTEATWRLWKERTGLSIVDGIGATEMMHIFVAATGEDIRPGSTGKAVPGYVATVLGEEGAPQVEGVGRLAVKGPTGCRYFDDSRQAEYVQNGWNVTGDRFRLDPDGYFWFEARSDDMIISSGYNIAAPEVEETLLEHPSVLECAVVGVPCPERGQKVKAFVVLADGWIGDDNLVERLQAHAKARMAPYKYPRLIEFVVRLPRTITGKLQRHVLRA